MKLWKHSARAEARPTSWSTECASGVAVTIVPVLGLVGTMQQHRLLGDVEQQERDDECAHREVTDEPVERTRSKISGSRSNATTERITPAVNPRMRCRRSRCRSAKSPPSAVDTKVMAAIAMVTRRNVLENRSHSQLKPRPHLQMPGEGRHGTLGGVPNSASTSVASDAKPKLRKVVIASTTDNLPHSPLGVSRRGGRST